MSMRRHMFVSLKQGLSSILLLDLAVINMIDSIYSDASLINQKHDIFLGHTLNIQNCTTHWTMRINRPNRLTVMKYFTRHPHPTNVMPCCSLGNFIFVLGSSIKSSIVRVELSIVQWCIVFYDHRNNAEKNQINLLFSNFQFPSFLQWFCSYFVSAFFARDETWQNRFVVDFVALVVVCMAAGYRYFCTYLVQHVCVCPLAIASLLLCA